MQCAANAALQATPTLVAFKYKNSTRECQVGSYPEDFNSILDKLGPVTGVDEEAVYLCKECRAKTPGFVLVAGGTEGFSPSVLVDELEVLDVEGVQATCTAPPKSGFSGLVYIFNILNDVVICGTNPVDCKVYNKFANTWDPYGKC